MLLLWNRESVINKIKSVSTDKRAEKIRSYNTCNQSNHKSFFLLFVCSPVPITQSIPFSDHITSHRDDECIKRNNAHITNNGLLLMTVHINASSNADMPYYFICIVSSFNSTVCNYRQTKKSNQTQVSWVSTMTKDTKEKNISYPIFTPVGSLIE